MQKRMYDADTIANAVGVTAQIHQKLYPMGHQPTSGQGSAENVPMAQETMEGHCLTCRAKHLFTVEGQETLKNGTIRKFGTSAEGHKMSHIVSAKAAA